MVAFGKTSCRPSSKQPRMCLGKKGIFLAHFLSMENFISVMKFLRNISQGMLILQDRIGQIKQDQLLFLLVTTEYI